MEVFEGKKGSKSETGVLGGASRGKLVEWGLAGGSPALVATRDALRTEEPGLCRRPVAAPPVLREEKAIGRVEEGGLLGQPTGSQTVFDHHGVVPQLLPHFFSHGLKNPAGSFLAGAVGGRAAELAGARQAGVAPPVGVEGSSSSFVREARVGLGTSRRTSRSTVSGIAGAATSIHRRKLVLRLPIRFHKGRRTVLPRRRA